ncbi:MAG TPA: SulP family inorganic anion transporter, partial [Acidimicrobiia bacterium]|nr:SulP family inorganic anion transporter [Acidimicrobiia bacterium]
NFVENVDDLLHGLDDIQWRTFALALSCAVILLGLKRFAPRVPGALVVVVFGIAMVRLQDLSAKGVAVLGTVDDGLPSLGFPDPKGWWILVPGAAAIALMSGLESATAAKILRRPQDPEIDANRELNATGAMNVAAGFVGAYPGGGGLSQSVVNSNAGATSQLSSLTTAVCAVIVLTVATGLLEDLPQAALGVIVIVAVSSFLDPRPLIAMSRVRTRDFGLAIVALVCACLFGMLEGVLVSLIVSVLVLMYQVNKVTIEDVTPPDLDGLMALRPRGLLYFANVQAVNDRTLRMVLDAQPRPRIVIIDFISVQDLEITALDSSRKLVDELLDAGIEPWAAGFSPGEAGMVGRYGPRQELRIFATLDDAIATYRRELDRGQ